jgi:diguanylate cyclase
MTLSRTPLLPWLLGRDAGVQRLLHYWALGLVLYLVSLAMLWYEVWVGDAPRRPVIWLSAASIAGAAAAYAAIRASPRLHIPAALLNNLQCVYAITCIICAYALIGPVRGVTLSILVVVLVFGGFSSTPAQVRALCGYAISLLGLTMLWKSQSDPSRYPWQQELPQFVIASAMLVAVAIMAVTLSRLRKSLKERALELATALDRIKDMARHDELTQLVNRRHMTEVLRQEFLRRERSGEPTCIAMLDIDHFKRVNDTLGHAAGDVVLRRFSQHAQASIRRNDSLARWGGEEFLLLLPATGLAAAAEVIERMRSAVHAVAWTDVDLALRVSFSAGLAEATDGESFESCIERADDAMYRAKREGRDRMVIAPAGRACNGHVPPAPALVPAAAPGPPVPQRTEPVDGAAAARGGGEFREAGRSGGR